MFMLAEMCKCRFVCLCVTEMCKCMFVYFHVAEMCKCRFVCLCVAEMCKCVFVYSAFSLESEHLRIRATITYSSRFSEVCMLQAPKFVSLNIKVI